MRKTIICLGLSAWLAGSGAWGGAISLVAQSSLPSRQIRAEAFLDEQIHGRNFIGWQHLALGDASSFIMTEQRPYLDALATLALSPSHEEELLLRLMARFPGSIDYHRARLLTALYFFERSPEDPRCVARLSQVDPAGLWQYERQQHHTLLGYLLLTRTSDAPSWAEARRLLTDASRSPSPWSDRAAMYLACLSWAEGQPDAAYQSLQRRAWQAESLADVEYLSALLRYALDRPEVALDRTRESIARYPELGQRIRLIGTQGQALYATGQYAAAVRLLDPIRDDERMLPAESFALGASLYQLKQYDQARQPLQQATRDDGAMAPLAHLMLGYILRHQGAWPEAQLAFASAAAHQAATSALRQQALYEQIELGFFTSGDAFGQQLRHVERFLVDHPDSQYTPRILELLHSYLSSSSDHAASLALIDRLETNGTPLRQMRQEVLVRWAAALPEGDERRLGKLNEALLLPARGEAYTTALIMRAAEYLRLKRYADAQQDAEQALTSAYGKTYQGGVANYLLGYARYNAHRYADAIAPLRTFAQSAASADLRADALVRLGDLHMQRSGKDKEAIALYRQAIALAPAGSDEALYRISSVYGQRGDYADQIRTLEELERVHPHSVYLPQSLYDRGRAEWLGDRDAQRAMKTLATIQERFPASELAPRAALEVALIESNRGSDSLALLAYRRVIDLYPDSPEARTALSDLRSLYSERKELDVYAQYVASLPGRLRPETEDEAHLGYIAIESRAQRGDDVREALEEYMRRYPRSRDLHAARTLLIRQSLAAGQSSRAIDLLRQSIESMGSSAESVALRVQLGDLLAQSGQEREACQMYHAAYTMSGGSSVTSKRAGMNYVRTAYSLQDYDGAIQVAAQILQRKDLDASERGAITLLRGRAEEGKKSYAAALKTYESLAKDVNTAHGAEAAVRHAELLMQLGRVAEAQKAMSIFVASGSVQQYWLARAFVTLADTYEAEGELYLAEQYIRSLKENYTGAESDIQEMINKRLTKYQSAN